MNNLNIFNVKALKVSMHTPSNDNAITLRATQVDYLGRESVFSIVLFGMPAETTEALKLALGVVK